MVSTCAALDGRCTCAWRHVDPRNGGDLSRAELEAQGVWPHAYATASTPSGGTHDFVASLAVGSRDKVRPGLDVKAGLPDGSSRGCAFLAPTVRVSKVSGELVAYRWIDVGDFDVSAWESDTSGHQLVEVVRPARLLTAKDVVRPARLLTAKGSDVRIAAAWTEEHAHGQENRHTGPIPGGARHTQLHEYSSRLRGLGMSLDEALVLMHRRWKDCIQPPEADHEHPWEEADEMVRDTFRRYEPGRAVSAVGGDGDPDPLVAREVANLRARRQAAEIIRLERAGSLQRTDLRSLTDFLSVDDEPAIYRVDRLWPIGGRVVLSAQYKAGKSTLRDNLVRALVDGTPFLDQFAVQPFTGRVVLIDDELDERMLRRWLRQQGIVNTDRVSVLPLRGRVGSLDLIHEATRRQWAQAIRDVDGAVVILDCLRPVLDALGLSEDKDAGRFLEAFDALLAESGASEGVVVHHMGHTGERSRGDTRLRDWPDVEWQLLRGDGPASAPRHFKAYGRDVDVPEGQLAYDDDTRRLTMVGGSRRETAAARLIPDLLDYLDENPGASQRMILTAFKHEAKAEVLEAIRQGCENGRIRTAPGPKRAIQHYRREPAFDVSALSAPRLRRRTADECASAPIEGALSTTELEKLIDGALDWLPVRLPSRQIVLA